MRGCYINEEGEIERTKVKIVWGCPASGKTTYVYNHKEYGDLIIDLDLIKQCISMENKTNAPGNLTETAILIRDYIYSIVSDRNINSKSVWIVAGLPEKEERDQLAIKVKADELIYIEASEEECIKRAMEDKERKNKEIQMKIIKKWFKKFYGE